MQQRLPNGSLFAGRYRVVSCLAWGGMGAVYEVVHVETDRRHALKVMLPEVVGSADQLARFKREAKIGAGLETEHVVQIFDAGIDEATQMPFLVMEMLHGEDLNKRLKRVKRLAPADVITYVSQAALALDEIHEASIVHRDLKPDNLFLTERKDGSARIKLLDFGIAKLVADGAAVATQALGTPLYMAPEQFQRDGRLSPATDIYALGMLTFTLLAGVPYWKEEMRRGSDVYAFVTLARRGPEERATARAARLGVTLPAAFDAWFQRATAVLPEHRFPSATAAVSALRRVFEVSSVRPVALPSESPSVPSIPLPPVEPKSLDATVALDATIALAVAPIPVAPIPVAPVAVAPVAPVAVAAPSIQAPQLSPKVEPAPRVARPEPKRRVSMTLVSVASAAAFALGLFATARPALSSFKPTFKPAAHAQSEAPAALYGKPNTPASDGKK